MGSGAEPLNSVCGAGKAAAALGHASIAPASRFGRKTDRLCLREQHPCLPCLQACSLARPCYYTAGSLAVLVASYLLLFFLASTLIVPGGLFM